MQHLAAWYNARRCYEAYILDLLYLSYPPHLLPPNHLTSHSNTLFSRQENNNMKFSILTLMGLVAASFAAPIAQPYGIEAFDR